MRLTAPRWEWAAHKQASPSTFRRCGNFNRAVRKSWPVSVSGRAAVGSCRIRPPNGFFKSTPPVFAQRGVAIRTAVLAQRIGVNNFHPLGARAADATLAE